MKRRVDLWPMPDPSSPAAAVCAAVLQFRRRRTSSIAERSAACASPDSTCCRWSARRRRSSAGSTTTASTSWCTARVSRRRAEARGLSRARASRFVYVRAVHRIAEQIEALVHERRIDAIFAALPFSWVAATPVARRLGIPIIWRAGGTESRTAEKMILAAWAAVSPPDLLVCCGQAVHDASRAWSTRRRW